jgi:hypothetical protein
LEVGFAIAAMALREEAEAGQLVASAAVEAGVVFCGQAKVGVHGKDRLAYPT